MLLDGAVVDRPFDRGSILLRESERKLERDANHLYALALFIANRLECQTQPLWIECPLYVASTATPPGNEIVTLLMGTSCGSQARPARVAVTVVGDSRSQHDCDQAVG